jgi:hypothetical protein
MEDKIKKVAEIYYKEGLNKLRDVNESLELIGDIISILESVEGDSIDEKINNALKKIVIGNFKEEKIIESLDTRSGDEWYHKIFYGDDGSKYIFYSSNTDFYRCYFCGSIYEEHQCNSEKFWIYRKIGNREYFLPVMKIK